MANGSRFDVPKAEFDVFAIFGLHAGGARTEIVFATGNFSSASIS